MSKWMVTFEPATYVEVEAEDAGSAGAKATQILKNAAQDLKIVWVKQEPQKPKPEEIGRFVPPSPSKLPKKN